MAENTALSFGVNRIIGPVTLILRLAFLPLLLLSGCTAEEQQPMETSVSELAVTPISLQAIAETATVLATLDPAYAQIINAPGETTPDLNKGNDIPQVNAIDGNGQGGNTDTSGPDEAESTAVAQGGPAVQENAPLEESQPAGDSGTGETDAPPISNIPPPGTKTISAGQGTPTLFIDPAKVNNIPIEEIVDISPSVKEHIKEIYALGQAKGRNPNAFSKLGDSLIANPHFLTGFDARPYDLGKYFYLQQAIDYFSGSFERYGVAIKAGLHSWGVFDPIWADKDWCQPNETLLACEIRLNNPSVLLVLLGSNDSGAPDSFDYNLRKVVDYSLDSGVIPVIVTKADRFEGPDNRNNLILRQIAADYQIPLWDFDLVAETLPGKGLQEDQVHLTTFVENDYTMTEAFQTGHGVHNLTALMVLDRIRQIVMEEVE